MNKEIAIIGLGLIGGSLGKALKKKRPEYKVIGIDVKPEIIEMAKQLGIIDEGTTNVEEGVRSAGLIFLAIPIQAMPQVCQTMRPHLQEGAIITDVCSTKVNVLQLME
ncbi:MAG: hypothetical protein CVU87_07000, partial [Firmicutes bacterium HGW-Firmicutes-12]